MGQIGLITRVYSSPLTALTDLEYFKFNNSGGSCSLRIEKDYGSPQRCQLKVEIVFAQLAGMVNQLEDHVVNNPEV